MSDKEEKGAVVDTPKKYADSGAIRKRTMKFINRHEQDLNKSFEAIDNAMLSLVGALSIEDSYPDTNGYWYHPDTSINIINRSITRCVETVVLIMGGIHAASKLKTDFKEIVFKALVDIEEKPKDEPKDVKEQILYDFEGKPEWLKEMVSNIINDKTAGDESE